MAKQKKDVVINLKPFDSEIRSYEGGFDWTFTAQMGETGWRRKRVVIKFDRRWVNYLAQDLKKALQYEIDELNRLRELVGFKENE